MKDRTDLLAILFALLFAVCPIQTKAAAVEPPASPPGQEDARQPVRLDRGVAPEKSEIVTAEPPTGPRQDYPASKRLFNPDTGHDYQLIDVSMPWHDAKKYCESLGGHLASVSSDAENAFMHGNFGRDRVCWLGASDETEEGKWQWVTTM